MIKFRRLRTIRMRSAGGVKTTNVFQYRSQGRWIKVPQHIPVVIVKLNTKGEHIPHMSREQTNDKFRKRNKEIYRLRLEGHTFAEIGIIHKLSRESIHRVCCCEERVNKTADRRLNVSYFRDTPIRDLEIDPRVMNGCLNAGLRTVGDMMTYNVKNMIGTPNFGPASLRELKRIIAKFKHTQTAEARE